MAVKGNEAGVLWVWAVAMGAQEWQMSSEGGENVVDLVIFESSTVPTVL